MLLPLLAGLLFVGLAVSYFVVQGRVGFWRARGLGVVIVAVLLLAYLAAIALSRLL